MSDETWGVHGIGGPGQRTTDHAGGRDPDFRQPIDNTLCLMLRRALEAAYLLLVAPLLAGPWALVVYVPALVEAVLLALRDWLHEDGDDPDRFSMLALGALVFAALIAAPDELLAWWPWAWQRSQASWRGVLWPAWWPAAVPVLALVRLALLTVPVYAWRETWYLTQRQRQEIVAPTASSVAYTSPAPHHVDIPGVWNPHRDPNAPVELREPDDAPTRRDIPLDQERAVTAYGAGVLVGNGNGRGEDEEDEEDGASLALPGPVQVELVAFPVGLFRGRGKQAALNAQTFARRVLQDENHYSQNWAVNERLLTDWKARQFFTWMQDNGHADPPDAQNQRALTGRGRRLLRKVARGEIEPV